MEWTRSKTGSDYVCRIDESTELQCRDRIMWLRQTTDATYDWVILTNETASILVKAINEALSRGFTSKPKGVE